MISNNNSKQIFFLILLLLISNIMQAMSTNRQSPKVRHTNRKLRTVSMTNILIITTDDMRAAAIPPYSTAEHPLYAENLHPKFSKFLTTATAFHGIAPVPVCGPSRASFLTGRYPDRLDIYSFERLFPQSANGINTVFKYFKDNLGYEAHMIGKITHTNPEDSTQDMEYATGHVSRPRVSRQNGNNDCGNEMYCTKKASSLADYDAIEKSEAFLREMAQSNKNFILGVGFHRPHITNSVPANYLKGVRGDIPDYSIPEIPGAPDYWHSLAYREDLGSARYKVKFAKNSLKRISEGTRKDTRDVFQAKYNAAVSDMRRGYYAGVRYTLDNVGKLIDLLEKYEFTDNTHVVFLADHGFQHGERRILGKNTLYYEATNVPFIIHFAGQNQSYFNKHPVSTRAIFPTLIELVQNANAVKNFNDGTGMPLDSKSLVAALTNPDLKTEDITISQYPRCDNINSIQQDDCMTAIKDNTCTRPVIQYMGYMIPTLTHRYTEWREFIEVRTECAKPTWPGMPSSLAGIGEKWWQINPKKTGTNWTSPPIQQELYQVINGKPFGPNLAVNPTSANQALMEQFSNKLKAALNGV